MNQDRERELIKQLKKDEFVGVPHIAKHTGLGRHSIYAWLRGERELGDNSIQAIRDYLIKKNYL